MYKMKKASIQKSSINETDYIIRYKKEPGEQVISENTLESLPDCTIGNCPNEELIAILKEHNLELFEVLKNLYCLIGESYIELSKYLN